MGLMPDDVDYIRRHFDRTASTDEQREKIVILSQLCACSVREVCKVLDMEFPKRRRISRDGAMRYPDAFRSMVLHEYRSTDISVRELCQKYRISSSTYSRWCYEEAARRNKNER